MKAIVWIAIGICAVHVIAVVSGSDCDEQRAFNTGRETVRVDLNTPAGLANIFDMLFSNNRAGCTCAAGSVINFAGINFGDYCTTQTILFTARILRNRGIDYNQ